MKRSESRRLKKRPAPKVWRPAKPQNPDRENNRRVLTRVHKKIKLRPTLSQAPSFLRRRNLAVNGNTCGPIIKVPRQKNPRAAWRKRMQKRAAAVLAGLLVSSQFASPVIANSRDSNTSTPIKHLVVIFGENISFDHYFGSYPYAANP